jgi:hypothetical protein
MVYGEPLARKADKIVEPHGKTLELHGKTIRPQG